MNIQTVHSLRRPHPLPSIAHSPLDFDVELLVVALVFDMKTEEVVVGGHEVARTKINILWGSLEMLPDHLVLCANYICGRWKVVLAGDSTEPKANGRTVGNGHVTANLAPWRPGKRADKP